MRVLCEHSLYERLQRPFKKKDRALIRVTWKFDCPFAIFLTLCVIVEDWSNWRQSHREQQWTLKFPSWLQQRSDFFGSRGGGRQIVSRLPHEEIVWNDERWKFPEKQGFYFFSNTFLKNCTLFFILICFFAEMNVVSVLCEAPLVQETGQKMVQYQGQNWGISSWWSCLWRWVPNFASLNWSSCYLLLSNWDSIKVNSVQFSVDF